MPEQINPAAHAVGAALSRHAAEMNALAQFSPGDVAILGALARLSATCEQLLKELQAQRHATEVSARLLRRWDSDGLPTRRAGE